ncbi:MULTISPECIES: crotonase/enoyl-CoA hydratase family protein [unclassified Mycobacterium]|uniref:crotonase/enoyl-CoA hydratase family protein n=1 Tax=unclassified Mycobacterium TaxID=2642494 RepID=UPI0029C79C47|nr:MULTISPECIES: crotonase/enoyl-CoA hydratase family protein [unclassified Mycobacterium]
MADVIVTRRGGIAVVSLNRPDKFNALRMSMWEELVVAGEALGRDRNVRAVVLRGEGSSFSTGMDTSTFEEMRTTRSITVDETASTRLGRLRDPVLREPGRITNLAQQSAYVWTELPQPVICAIRGYALGAGLQVALGADIRIVSPDAKLGLLEINWGMVPDTGGTASLVRLVGADVAKELIWTARRVDGVEAVRLGLATRVAEDPDVAAMSLAAEIAKRSPDAIRAGKRLIREAQETGYAPAFLAESHALAALAGSPNQLEAVAAAVERRTAEFIDSVEE